MRVLRVFVSSPGDVEAERLIARRVIERVGTWFQGRAVLQPVLWEDAPLRATASFQAGIDEMSPVEDLDVVVFILWSRLGTPLGLPAAPGQTPPTGTEWEFERARALAERGQRPDILVYRRTQDPPLPALRDGREALTAAVEQYAGVERFFERWFRDPAGVSFTAAFHTYGSPEGFEALLERHLRDLVAQRLARSRSGSPAWGGSPFRGLLPYDVEHQAVFFGRARASAEALRLLQESAARGTAFLLITGASGTGKSSLARAGLLAQLSLPSHVESGAREGRVVRVGLRPGESATPLAALRDALLAHPDLGSAEFAGPVSDELLTAWTESPTALVAWLRSRLARSARGTAESGAAPADSMHGGRLALLVDQLEEAFAPTVTDAQRQALGRALLALACSGTAWVVATLRSDTYGRLAETPELARLRAQGGVLDLAAPSMGEIAEMVTLPAEVAGLAYERHPSTRQGLDAALIEAAARDPGALPLLQFTLQALYERREGTALTWAAYESLHGLEGALVERAEACLSACSPAARAAFPDVVRQLVEVSASGDPLRRRVARARVTAQAPAAQLVERLLAERLLVSDVQGGEAQVSVAHEALLRHWDRAREAIQARRELLSVLSRLRPLSDRWHAEERSDSLLLQEGKPLEEGLAVLSSGLDLDAGVVAFVQASQRRAGTRRRRRRIVLVSILLLAAAAGAMAVLAEGRRRETEAARVKEVASRTRAEGVLRFMVSELQPRLQALSRLDILQPAAERARDYYADQPWRDLSAGEALLRAQAQRDMSALFGSLGRLADAERAALEAIEIADALSQRDPRAEDPQVARVDSWITLAGIRDAQGRRVEARDLYDRALALCRALVDLPDGFARHGRRLWQALHAVGDDQQTEAQVEEALRTLQEAQSLSRRALAADPDSLDCRYRLAQDHQMLGNLLADRGDLARALTEFRSGLALMEEVVRLDPTNGELLRALASLAHSAAWDLERQGRHDEALPLNERAVRLTAGLAAADPRNQTIQVEHITALERVADDLVALGRLKEAADAVRQAQRSLARLVELDASNAGWSGHLAASHLRLARIANSLGDLVEALAQAREAVALYERRHAADPSNSVERYQLASALDMLGDHLGHQGRGGEALVAHGSARSHLDALLGLQPGNTAWRGSRVGNLHRTGDLLLRAGRPGEALEDYRRSLEVVEQSLAADASNIGLQGDLLYTLTRVGDAERALGRSAQAREAYERGREVGARLVARAPGLLEWQDESTVPLDRLGDLLARTGRLEEALASYQRALAIRQDLVTRDPANESWRSRLTFSHYSIGCVLEALGRLPDAEASHRACLRERRTLALANPTHARRRYDVSSALTRLGDVLESQGRLDDALEAHRESLDLVQRLSEEEPQTLEWARELAIRLQRLAGVQARRGESSPLQATCARLTAVLDDLVGRAPGQAEWAQMRASLLSTAAGYLEQTGAVEMSDRLRAAALAAQEDLVARHPDMPDCRRELSVLLNEQADRERRAGRLARAHEISARSAQIMQALVDSDSANDLWRQDLGLALSGLGDCLHDAGRLPEAAQHYARACTIFEREAERPSGLALRAAWAATLGRLADTWAALGDLAEAESARHKAMALLEALNESERSAEDRALLERLRAALTSTPPGASDPPR